MLAVAGAFLLFPTHRISCGYLLPLLGWVLAFVWLPLPLLGLLAWRWVLGLSCWPFVWPSGCPCCLPCLLLVCCLVSLCWGCFPCSLAVVWLLGCGVVGC